MKKIDINQIEKNFLARLIKMYGISGAAEFFKQRLGYDAPEELLVTEEKDEGIDLNNMYNI